MGEDMSLEVAEQLPDMVEARQLRMPPTQQPNWAEQD